MDNSWCTQYKNKIHTLHEVRPNLHELFPFEVTNAFASENRSDSNSTTNRRSGACYQRERKATEENAVRECVMSHQPPFARQKSRTKEKEREHDQALSSSGERMQASSCHELKEALGSSGSWTSGSGVRVRVEPALTSRSRRCRAVGQTGASVVQLPTIMSS